MVSHASGELVELVARNAVAQLPEVDVERNTWKFVRSLTQLPQIIASIAERPGFVFHSIAAVDLRSALEDGCKQLRLPCVFVLEPFVSLLAKHFKMEVQFRPSNRDSIDEDYYRRVEAMKFALAHDDGLASDDLAGADVVLLGVSRATKTPTCMYLASCGLKAANVPLVPGVPLPDHIAKLKGPLVVGLTINPKRLAAVRKARLETFGEDTDSDYANIETVSEELRQSRLLVVRRGWQIIDVSTRSVEQTANMILNLLEQKKTKTARGEL